VGDAEKIAADGREKMGRQRRSEHRKSVHAARLLVNEERQIANNPGKGCGDLS
jgi:hypothetical protein